MLLAAAILASVVLGAPDFHEVSWQAHSYNDLRAWHQLLRKGASSAKIDMNYVTDSAVCSANGQSSPCFLLNHDAPVLGRKFWSPHDLLDLLANSTDLIPTGGIQIALCFKNVPSTVCVAGDGWLPLVDAFHERATAPGLSALNLSFVLDGSGVPRDCFVDRWRPWPATYSDKPTSAFDSNNRTLGYDRYQVFNDRSSLFPLDAARGYGKFPASKFAWQTWEPSDEPSIGNVLSVYRQVGVRHPAGFRFAINIDPAQFQVYAANSSGRGWHAPLDEAAGFTAPSVLTVPARDGSDVLVVYDAGGAAQGNTSVPVHLLRARGITQPVVACGPIAHLPPLPGARFTLSLAAAATAQASVAALLLCSDVACADVHVDTARCALVESVHPSPPSPARPALRPAHRPHAVRAAPSRVLAVAAMPRPAGASTPRGLLLLVSAGGGGCAATLEIRPRAGASATAPLASVCVPGPASAVSATVAAWPGQEDSTALPSAGVAVAWTQNDTVGLTAAHAAFNGSAWSLRLLTSSPEFAVGSSASLAARTAGGRAAILLAVGDGRCFNTEHYNKIAGVALCDQSIPSTPGVVNYFAAEWPDLQRAIAASLTGHRVGPCFTGIIAGTADVGSAPVATLLGVGSGVPTVAPTDPLAGLAAAVVRTPLAPGRATDLTRECGLSFDAEKGGETPVLAGWQLVGSGWVGS